MIKIQARKKSPTGHTDFLGSNGQGSYYIGRSFINEPMEDLVWVEIPQRSYQAILCDWQGIPRPRNKAVMIYGIVMIAISLALAGMYIYLTFTSNINRGWESITMISMLCSMGIFAGCLSIFVSSK